MTDRQTFRWNAAIAAFSLVAAGAYAYAGGLMPHVSKTARMSYCADDVERRAEPFGAVSVRSRKDAVSAKVALSERDSQNCVREVVADH